MYIYIGLPVSKSLQQEHINRGKSNAFRYDVPVSFNNKYRQTLDESGMPLLKNIFAGVFTATDKLPEDRVGLETESVVQPRPEGKRAIRPDNFQMAQDLNVPMVQAVMEVSLHFYFCSFVMFDFQPRARFSFQLADKSHFGSVDLISVTTLGKST